MQKKKSFINSALFSIGCSLVATFISSWVSTIVGGETFLNSIESHLKHNAVVYITGIPITTLIGGVLFSYAIPGLRKLENFANMARTAGFTTILKSLENDEQAASQYKSDLREKCENQEEISIICTTGFSIFSTDNSLLGDTLQTIKRRINVFLLDPSIGCETTKIRAASIGKDRNELRKNIVNSISYLKQLSKNPHVQIKVYLYNFYPNFGIVSCGNNLWVQCYGEKNHIDRSPIIEFSKLEASENPRGVHCFFNSFIHSLLLTSDLSSQPLNPSIQLIEDLNTWQYPGDLQNSVSINNIEPCKRISGIPCRRMLPSVSLPGKKERIVKDRRGLDPAILDKLFDQKKAS